MKFSNVRNVHPLIARWLLMDDYDNHGAKGVSATGLIKPIRQSILQRRLARGEVRLMGETITPPPVDVSTILKNRYGQAIHSSLEDSLRNLKEHPEAFKELYPKFSRNLNLLKVNPEDQSDPRNSLFLELRGNRLIGDIPISGKFDFVFRGQLGDFKTTSTYLSAANDPVKFNDYVLQASIYRWIFPQIVLEDTALFIEIFGDWNETRANNSEEYPQSPVVALEVPLMSLQETEDWIVNRLSAYDSAIDLDEFDIPDCTDEELWVAPSEWKYYTKPTNKRATRNFKGDKAAGERYLAEKGVGVLIEVKGSAIRCNYCPAFVACTQKDRLIAEGRLEVR